MSQARAPPLANSAVLAVRCPLQAAPEAAGQLEDQPLTGRNNTTSAASVLTCVVSCRFDKLSRYADHACAPSSAAVAVPALLLSLRLPLSRVCPPAVHAREQCPPYLRTGVPDLRARSRPDGECSTSRYGGCTAHCTSEKAGRLGTSGGFCGATLNLQTRSVHLTRPPPGRASTPGPRPTPQRLHRHKHAAGTR